MFPRLMSYAHLTHSPSESTDPLMKNPALLSRLRACTAIALALLLTAGVTLLQTPAPASALQIDCSYSPGLKQYLDSGAIPGVGCHGSVSDPSGGNGGGGGKGGDGRGSNPNCVPSTSNLPNNFLANVSLHDSTSWSSASYAAEGWTVGTRRNYIKNRLHSELSIYSDWEGPNEYIRLVYRLWERGTLTVASYNSKQSCSTGFVVQKYPDIPAPSGTGVPREQNIVGIGEPMTPALGRMETRGSLTLLTGSTDRYLLRLDFTNPADAGRSTPVFLDVNTGSTFGLASVVSVPSDSECDIVADGIQTCTLPVIVPGQTRSLVFEVHAAPDAPADATLGITVGNLGFLKIDEETDWGIHTVKDWLPVENYYALTRPAPPAPLPPVCEPADPDAAPVAPGATAEQIISGSTVQLQSHCSHQDSLSMQATAGHGTASVSGYGWVTYTPETGYLGADVIEVVAVDAATGQSSSPARIDVNVVAPASARDDAYEVSANTPLTGRSLLANDSVPGVGQWLVQQGLTPPAHGVLQLDTRTGDFTYTPRAGFTGVDSFRYRLSGPNGTASSVATVTFTVS